MASQRTLDWNTVQEWLRNIAALQDSITGVDDVVAAAVRIPFGQKAYSSGLTQLKLDASLGSPDPLYFTYFG